MRAFVRRHPFGFFYALSVIITMGVMAVYALLIARDPRTAQLLFDLQIWIGERDLLSNLVSIARYAAEGGRPAALLILVFAGAPTMAALVTSALAGGRIGLGPLVARLKPWGSRALRPRALRVYLALGLLYALGLVFYLALIFATAETGLIERTWRTLGSSWPTLVGLLFIGLFLDEGGTLEELGWRGFALPLLQERMSPLCAAVVLGILWHLWHLPREIPTLLGGGPLGPWFVNQGIFMVLTIALSIVIACAVNLTGGSVLPAILIHGGTNVWSKVVGAQAYVLFETDVRTWIVAAAAVLTVLVAGRELGRGRAQS